MDLYYCSTCGGAVSEMNIRAGTAVQDEPNRVFCPHCVTTGHAKVSDSKVLRSLLARGAERALLRPVRQISQRLIAQFPTGKIKRFANRVSERLLGPGTGRYLPMKRRVPRRQLPAGSCATLAAVSQARSEAQGLAIASIIGVVVAVFTLIVYMGYSAKPEETQQAAPPVRIAPAVRELPASPAATPVEVAARPLAKPAVRSALFGNVDLSVPAAERSAFRRNRVKSATSFAQPSTEAVDNSSPAIPPLLIERESGPVSTPAYKAHAAEQRAAAAPVVSQTEEPSVFAAWEVEGLYKNARAKELATLDGYACVLETHPPEAGKDLRIRWKLTVPADRPILEFIARADERGECLMTAEVAGNAAQQVTLKGAQWRAFSLDLSAYRRQPVTVSIRHRSVGDEIATAYWQTPLFFSIPANDATQLSLGAAKPASVEAPAAKPSITILPVAKPEVNQPAPRETGSDLKVEYEKTLSGLYKLLNSSGVQAAREYLAVAKASPTLAPMRAQLELDQSCINYVDELRQSAQRGAKDLLHGHAFKLVALDGKEIFVGNGVNVVKDVNDKGITFEQAAGSGKALMILKWEDTSFQTQHDLAQLMLNQEQASLNMAMVKLVILSRNSNSALVQEIEKTLASLTKFPALAVRAENLQRHLDYFRREAAR